MLTIVGAGRVGRSLAAALEAGPLTDRVELLHGTAPPESGPARTQHAAARGAFHTLVFCVPDDALSETAATWASAMESVAGRGFVALHTSGVHPASALDPLRSIGFAAAAWHPLTVVERPDAAAVRSVTWGVEGDERAVERAAGLISALEGRMLRVAPAEHARYHGAAVLASNALVACLAAATRELAAAAEGPADARDLLPLARAALDAVEREGLEGGLTGPVARGDAGTVRRHLDALEGVPRELYRAAALELLELVGAGLPAGRAEEVRRSLRRETEPASTRPRR